MVYFTCNNCGSSLKKNAVDKHRGQCRHPLALTCVDCHKDFYGQDYVDHTKCITEDEKYSAKGFQSRPQKNKGELKQQSWVEMVKYVSTESQNLSRDERQLLSTMTKLDNIPQKKQKFQNFVKNVWPAAKSYVVDSVWDLLETENKKRKEKLAKDNASDIKNNGTEESTVSPDEVEACVEEGDSLDKEIVVEEKLSKKEKKNKRKREKYEAELVELNTNCGDDKLSSSSANNEVGKIDDENVVEKLSKKEKKKLKKDESRPDPVQNAESKSKKKKKGVHNGVGDSKIGDSRPKEIDETEVEGKSKRKRKQEEIPAIEPSKKKSRENGDAANSDPVEDDVTVSSSKFNWSETIIKVLEKSDDKELRVKRLRKKVLAEYEINFEGSEIDVKIIAKFNRKLSKTHGVVVLKDRAKLKCQ